MRGCKMAPEAQNICSENLYREMQHDNGRLQKDYKRMKVY